MTFDLCTTRKILFSRRISTDEYHNTRRLELSQHNLNSLPCLNNVSTTMWSPLNQALQATYVAERGGMAHYRENLNVPFLRTFFNLFIITSGCHFRNMALFSMKCNSNALAFCVIATILVAQGRVSHIYDSKSPTRSSQNELFRLPHCTQSISIS